jgi:hypothetical protein
MAKIGRPKKYKSAKQMQVVIDSYFEKCDKNTVQVYDKKAECVIEIEKPIPYTIEGLCVALNMDRVSLLNYAKDEEFFSTVKAAKDKVLSSLVEKSISGGAVPSIAIFLLKNNYGYTDRTEQKLEHSGEVTVKASLKDFYEDIDE